MGQRMGESQPISRSARMTMRQVNDILDRCDPVMGKVSQVKQWLEEVAPYIPSDSFEAERVRNLKQALKREFAEIERSGTRVHTESEHEI